MRNPSYAPATSLFQLKGARSICPEVTGPVSAGIAHRRRADDTLDLHSSRKTAGLAAATHAPQLTGGAALYTESLSRPPKNSFRISQIFTASQTLLQLERHAQNIVIVNSCACRDNRSNILTLVLPKAEMNA